MDTWKDRIVDITEKELEGMRGDFGSDAVAVFSGIGEFEKIQTENAEAGGYGSVDEYLGSDEHPYRPDGATVFALPDGRIAKLELC